ncbi:MAG: ribonuclease P protein component [Candidatus Cloacimonas sp.]|jgi:ribonuclease P protein component|nr:ribonuclease P protein component [Candidatus Cloacimonas sp.]
MVWWIKSHAHYGQFKQADFQIRTAFFYVPVLIREGEPAVGITISRKVGNAVVRNLLKRRIKAWTLAHAESIPSGFQFNLVAKSNAGELSWLDLCAQLSSLCATLQKRNLN